MNRTLLITRQEIILTLKRRTYLFFAFGVPALVVIIFSVIQYIQARSSENRTSSSGLPGNYNLKVEGYVDLSGAVKMIPKNLPPEHLLAYPSEALARQALDAGKITAYYVIPSDYPKEGEFFYVYPEDKSLISDGQDWVMQWTLLVNLLDGDAEAADYIWNPVWYLETQNLAPGTDSSSGEDCSRPGFACESNLLVRYLPLVMIALFYISFMSTGNMLFNSISSEKENRTIEVLLLSITPHQMFVGKTIAYGFAGLLQTVTWLAAITILLMTGGQVLDLPSSFTFPAYILIWSLVFFLGGLSVYACLMAGAGALAHDLKEAGAASVIAMMPLFAGYFVGYMAQLAERTNEALPVSLSLFPLTAPILMVMRLTSGMVPVWQLLLAAGLTYATAYLVLRGVSAMFHAQNLLSGQPFSFRRYFRELFAWGSSSLWLK